MLNIINEKDSLPVVDIANKNVGEATLPSAFFGIEANPVCVQRAIKTALANARQATAKTKTISEVSGTGKKPWRQKGTGRARAGSTRSPIWVGGATIFGPTGTQNYKLKQNKQEYFIALASVLSEKVAEKKLVICDFSSFVSGKTKDLVNVLKAINVEGKVLIALGDYFSADANNDTDIKLCQAGANIPTVAFNDINNLSIYDIVNADYLVLSKGFVDQLVEDFEAQTEEAE